MLQQQTSQPVCSLPCADLSSYTHRRWGEEPWARLIPSAQLPAGQRQPSSSLGSLAHKEARYWHGGHLPLLPASRQRWAEGRFFFALTSRTLSGAGCVEGHAWGISEEGCLRPGFNFLVVLMVGEGLGSQQVTLFMCLELRTYHLPCLARCHVSHLCHHFFGHTEREAE